MALGIESNSIAPQLIQNSGQALVQGIRQIGQQISGHLTEMQTKRDLAGLAQSLQGANVQSGEFPVQLAQIASQHPMAVRDERGQMLMSILGKAHGAWQATENDVRNFKQQMEMMKVREGIVDRRTREQRDYESTRPIVSGGRVISLQDPQNPQVILDLPEKPEGPYTLNPGDVRFGPGGKKIAENPKTPSGDNAQTSQRRLILGTQLDNLDRELKFSDAEHRRLLKEEDDIKKELEGESDTKKKGELEYRRSVKAMDAEKARRGINEIRAQKLKIAEQLGELGQALEPELGVVPPNAAAPVAPAGVLPPAGVVVPAPVANEMILVIDPSGRPGKIRASQREAALQNGYRLR